MSLTQLATVKARIGLPEEDVKDDAYLEGLIDLVSGWFEKDTNRQFGYQEDSTEEFGGDAAEISVPRYPIAPDGVTAFHLKSNETDGWQVQTGIDFLIRRNCILSLTTPIGSGREIGRVTYNGGYVLPGGEEVDDVLPLPEEIQRAIIEQIAYLYQNKDRLGISSISGSKGSISANPVSVVKPLPWLPIVQQMVTKYERWVL